MTSKRSDKPPPGAAPTSLGSIRVDVTGKIGSHGPPVKTGLQTLDNLLAGGLRLGDFLGIAGPSGIGKTALALHLAYLAARTKTASVFVSATLDETEIVARLAARALFRERPEAKVSYGSIWSGQAFQSPATRSAASAAVETVAKKVGPLLYVKKLDPFASTTALRHAVAALWARHERVVMIVDGLDAFHAAGTGTGLEPAQLNAEHATRLVHVGYELRQIAAEGCAVVATLGTRDAELVAPAMTLAAELRAVESGAARLAEHLLLLGTRPLELVVKKNRAGPTGIVPLRFIAGAATFEERAP